MSSQDNETAAEDTFIIFQLYSFSGTAYLSKKVVMSRCANSVQFDCVVILIKHGANTADVKCYFGLYWKKITLKLPLIVIKWGSQFSVDHIQIVRV